MKDFKSRVIIAGPTRQGKSTLARQLVGASLLSGNLYEPFQTTVEYGDYRIKHMFLVASSFGSGMLDINKYNIADLCLVVTGAGNSNPETYAKYATIARARSPQCVIIWVILGGKQEENHVLPDDCAQIVTVTIDRDRSRDCDHHHWSSETDFIFNKSSLQNLLDACSARYHEKFIVPAEDLVREAQQREQELRAKEEQQREQARLEALGRVIPPPKYNDVIRIYALIDASNDTVYTIKMCQPEDGEVALAYLFQDDKVICLFERDKRTGIVFQCTKCATDITYQTLEFNRAQTTALLDTEQFIVQLMTPLIRLNGRELLDNRCSDVYLVNGGFYTYDGGMHPDAELLLFTDRQLEALPRYSV